MWTHAVRRRWLRLIPTVAALAALPSACGDDGDTTGAGGTTTATGDTTTAATGTGGGGSSLVWMPCDAGYECTTVAVPIDYDDPASETIDLAVMRAPAKGERRGVLFVNQGGPGAPTIAWLADFYAHAFAVFFPLATEHFDVVAIDWRGVGESEQIQCDITAEDAAIRALPLHPSPGAERDAYANLFAQYQSSCVDGHGGALFARMGTEYAARDMDRVREALGEDEISFLGMSYGGYLGAVYASLFPAHVRAFVLDSPASPTPDLSTDIESWASAIEPGYQTFFDSCGADPACPFHGGEGGSAVALAYETLLVDLEASGGLAVGSRTLTRGDAGKAVYPKITSAVFGQLASALHDLELGDGAALLAAADGWYAGSGPTLLDTQIIFCEDRSATSAGLDPFWTHLASLEAGAGEHVGFDIGVYWGICRDWPNPRPPLTIGAATAPPLLVVVGTADVWAPRVYGEATVASLGNGSHLLVGDNPGHVQSTNIQSLCAAQAVDAFLDDPTTSPSTTDCNL